MTRSLEQISKDLETLEQSTAQIDQAFRKLYREYFNVLGQALKRQLTLAVYHLCTQVYPEAFLDLAVSEREKLQQGIRKIADQGLGYIEKLGEVVFQEEEATASDIDQAEAVSAEGSPSPPSIDHDSAETATLSSEDASDASERTGVGQALSAALSLLVNFSTEPLSPITLAKRHVLLEKQLMLILQTVSSSANHLLKQLQLLPDLPEMVLAAAAAAEAGEPSHGTPNLLNVLVEVGGNRSREEVEEPDDNPEEEEGEEEEEAADSNMTHLVAINLRLTDIEFADTHTALWRSKLQETLARLKRLGNQYQKLNREKSRAEAEHAWRAIWFEA